jgi:uncharacterized membrane protein YgdD (TMEM256/DUF423 family)
MLAVIFGAFGAHALRGRLTPDMLEVYHTGAQYQIYHSLGLLLIGVLALRFPETCAFRWAGWLMLVGIVLFSGSLYVLAMSGVRALGAITPLGGLAFIAAWVAFVVGVLRT